MKNLFVISSAKCKKIPVNALFTGNKNGAERQN